MKTRFPNHALFGILLFLFATATPLMAQTNFVLHNFALGNYATAATADTNSDGIYPNGWLTWSGTKFYGTALKGGTNGSGTIFAFDTNGTFTLLYSFPKNPTNSPGNTFGANPNGGLVLSGTNLYGTTQYGGVSNNGVIFSIVTNGTGIAALHTNTAFINTNFLGYYTNTDGANSAAGLIMSGKFLFGTTKNGGFGGSGVVFSCSNTTYKVLYHFSTGNRDDFGTFTNGDGANPTSQLLLVGTNLFGTTTYGGAFGYGTLFKISTNGSNFVVLHHFDDNDLNGDHGAGQATGPSSGLVFSGGTLFGIGGSVIYMLSTNGSGFTNLWSFPDYVDDPTFSPPCISGLTVSNGTLYGTTSFKNTGSYGCGQVFALTTNGLNFADFHDFTFPAAYPAYKTNSDGYFPVGAPVLVNNCLYGVTVTGGTNAVNSNNSFPSGVIFRASPTPKIAWSQMSGMNYVLGVQTFDGLSYTIQQRTNLTSGSWIQYSNFMGNSTSNVMQISVPATNSPMYFRLRQP